MTQETCVLCNAKLETKEALKDHFRKHANKEIDSKGCPIAKDISVPNFKPVKLPTKKTGPRSPLSLLKPSAASEKTLSSGSRQPIKCDVCELPFENVAKAISHRWKAHPEQPSKFFCSHCGKHFPLKTILDNHVANQHTNTAPKNVVRCANCGEEFFNQAALSYHAKIAHKRVDSVLRPVATPPPSKKIRLNNAGEADSVYYCHLCGSEYILKFNLRKHLEVRHAAEDTSFGLETEIIRCTICEAVFCNKRAYEVHNMYHQPDDMYVTSEEHRLKIVSRVDQDFDLRRVQIQQPKSVRGLAMHYSKTVWNAPFNSLASNAESNSIVTKIMKNEDPSESPSKVKSKQIVSKGQKTTKRTRSNSSCDAEGIRPVDKRGEPSSPPKIPPKGKNKPRILKANKNQKGNSLCSPSVGEHIPLENSRSKGKSSSPSSLHKDEVNSEKKIQEALTVESSRRVLRSSVSKN
ncbi:zinc finger and BTB domain-containing protein 41-like [Thrips palmi]|uniref:Zinc finger and BTB domain-containing protein 41-like n=1 Tax=Thrips palmi TaxID=161013 RepID=A0A6P8ZLX8_THRPL|nr:zinc finger and BTB domain-containing protein 41-like [Thrips palmi]XP_034239629.1 zinc finger and BTB domain-containing protein 41-like [Thrips palmi]